jgi:uncharacterized protein YbaR (Trm112 family)
MIRKSGVAPMGLAFPIRDDIPVMLADEARTLTADERTDR